MKLPLMLLTTLLLGAVSVNGECTSGVPGIANGDVCCAKECGSCGGSGCDSRPGGADSCCTSDIISAGSSCDDTGAGPCMISSSATDPNAEGCFADTLSERVMTAPFSSDSMTPESCNIYCGEMGYYYYGLQWGIECWCASSGTDLGKHGSGSCNFACGGDINHVCGGYYAFTAYKVGTEASGPSPTPPMVATPFSSPSPNPSPTPIMTIPTSCDLPAPAFRWNEDSGVNGRIYAEGEGCFTMTDLYNFRGTWNDGKTKGPVYVLDEYDRRDEYPSGEFTGKWLLTAELYVTGGATFYCRGTDIGGDCDELRIQSRSSNDYHEIRGHGGNLYFENTIVTSWDTDSRKPQEEYKNGRSYLNCLSERLTGTTCAKDDMGECRMDIINSEVAYLGFDDAESYGITWKVRGFCEDESNPDVFDKVDVFGDIQGSDIHHLYYGQYSYGHQGGVWINNKMHDNIQYGFDPHDDSDYLTIAGNEVYNNVNHGIIASKRCNNLKIYNNEVRDGGPDAVGIFLHRSADDCEVYDNVITNMQDAGIALMESFDADIHDNVIDGAEFGIRMNLGAGNNKVYDNTFNDIHNVGLFTYYGADPPWINDGRPYDNQFYDNTFTDTEVGIKLKESDSISIKNNEFSGTKEIEFSDAQETKMSGNSFPSETCLINQYDSSTFSSSSGLPDEC